MAALPPPCSSAGAEQQAQPSFLGKRCECDCCAHADGRDDVVPATVTDTGRASYSRAQRDGQVAVADDGLESGVAAVDAHLDVKTVLAEESGDAFDGAMLLPEISGSAWIAWLSSRIASLCFSSSSRTACFASARSYRTLVTSF